MTWFDHHQYSEKLAAAAQSALQCGDEPGARRIYAQAAQEAEKALALVPRWKQVRLFSWKSAPVRTTG